MPIRLSTLLASIDTSVPNPTNASLIKEFYNFMKSSNTSESYQKNNLKTVISFVKWLGNNMTLYEITKKEQIIAFLDTKIKSTDKDPDKRWITTWCNTPARQRALVLQGDGALGAYEAGVLEVLCKKLADEDKECRREDRLIFDIVAGTSIGAMNASHFCESIFGDPELGKSSGKAAKILVRSISCKRYTWL